MAVSGWLTENSLRSFPLVLDPDRRLDASGTPTPLPNQTIVDFGSEAGPLSGYETGGSAVYLDSISRSGSTVTFVLKGTSSGLAGQTLTFRRSVDDAEFTTEFAAAVPGATDGCGTHDVWRGYLTTGPLGPLLSVLPDGATLTGGAAFRFEPTLTRSTAGSYVRTVQLANRARVVAEPGTVTGFDSSIHELAGCITPVVDFSDGYNVSVQPDDTTNTITFASAAGAGLGEPCAEFPAYPDEPTPAGSVFLGGGPACGELITSINGQHGKRLKLVAGPGVTVTTDPTTPHRILVDFGMTDLGSCPS